MTEFVCVQPEFAALLRSHGLKSFDDFFHLQSDVITSSHRYRETLRITLDTSDKPLVFYLKRVRHVPVRLWWRDLCRLRLPHAQPRRERAAIDALRRRGIGVMAAAAVGWRSTFGMPREAFLLVAAVPAEETLQDRLRHNNLSADLIGSLGNFVRQLHRDGHSNPDLVSKHIFIAPGDPLRFFLIDVERLEPATPRGVRRDLSRLFRDVTAHSVKRTDLLRFARAYAEATGSRTQRRSALAEHFAFAREDWRRLTRRARRPVLLPDDMLSPDDLNFTRLGRVVCLSRFTDLVQHHHLDEMTAWNTVGAQTRLDKPRLKSWRIRQRIQLTAMKNDGGSPLTLYLKHFVRPPVGEQIKRLLSGRAGISTAGGEWRRIKELTRDRVATMTPFAYGEQMIGPIERESLFVTLAVPGESLERWIPEHLAPETTSLTLEQRRFFLRQLAYFIAGFHDTGAVHRDLYLSHVYLSLRKDGQPAFRLIDLQRVFVPRFRWRRWVVKDLAALHYSTAPQLVSRTERLRWLRDYLTPEAYRQDRRGWVTAVLAKAEKMEAHNQKHAGPDALSKKLIQQPAAQLP